MMIEATTYYIWNSNCWRTEKKRIDNLLEAIHSNCHIKNFQLKK